MSTTFILAGGADTKNPDYWDSLSKFFLGKKLHRLLSCQFSQPDNEWEERFESFHPFFRQAFGDESSAVLASIDNFDKQLEYAEIIYLHGGSTEKLTDCINNIENFREKVKGKVVIGSSAGAQYLSQKYWSPSSRSVGSGSGITPFNVIVHYNSDYRETSSSNPIDWEVATRELSDEVGKQGIILLPEGEFIIFES